MIDRFRDIARALVGVLLLGMAGAAAQTAQSQTSPNSGAPSQTAQAAAQPAGPAGPQINIAEITARANRDVGVNIETAINGWQQELDRLESYGCDPRKVRATLLKVAQDNPDVMTTPAASVDFDFGADSLNFKLYAFAYDLNKGGSASTDLRIAILDAFNEAGIAMPSRQTDATPQNMDWLRQAVAEYVSGSYNGTGSGNGKTSSITKQATIPAV